MKAKIDIGAQFLLGLIFFVFGLNGFFHFLALPPLGEKAGNFMGALAATGYFFPVMASLQTIAGLCLLARAFSPLALVLLAPIVAQILLFHLFLDPAGLPIAVVVTVLEAYLGFAVYGSAFAGILRPRG